MITYVQWNRNLCKKNMLFQLLRSIEVIVPDITVCSIM
jgi:hypothetical protein